MRTAMLGAAVLIAAISPATAQDSADERLTALADAFYDYQLATYELVETESGQTRQGDSLPSVTPETQRGRAARYADLLDKLQDLESE